MIRPFGLRDVLLLRHLEPYSVAFDLQRYLLCSPSPLRSALFGYFTHRNLGTLTCIHRDSKQEESEAFAQVWPRADRQEWDLAFVAPTLDAHQGTPDLWHKLLSHLIVLGAGEGVLRIYARSPEDGELEAVLRRAGFAVVAREEIFALSHQRVPAPRPQGLRRVDHQDREALEELYLQVVPPLVHQAEGFSHSWRAASQRVRPGLVSEEEYIWSAEGKAVAHLRLCSGAKRHWLEIVVRSECRAELLPHIRCLLSLTGHSVSAPVYCPVPDYGVGLGWLLRTLGFESYARQVLLVAHTVARVPVRRQMVVPGLERGVDIGAPVVRGSRRSCAKCDRNTTRV